MRIGTYLRPAVLAALLAGCSQAASPAPSAIPKTAVAYTTGTPTPTAVPTAAPRPTATPGYERIPEEPATDGRVSRINARVYGCDNAAIPSIPLWYVRADGPSRGDSPLRKGDYPLRNLVVGCADVTGDGTGELLTRHIVFDTQRNEYRYNYQVLDGATMDTLFAQSAGPGASFEFHGPFFPDRLETSGLTITPPGPPGSFHGFLPGDPARYLYGFETVVEKNNGSRCRVRVTRYEHSGNTFVPVEEKSRNVSC